MNEIDIQKINQKILIQSKNNFNINNLFIEKEEKNEIWQERKYKLDIINYSSKYLLKNSMFYLEFATGAVKTYIIYKILSLLTKEKKIKIESPTNEKKACL